MTAPREARFVKIWGRDAGCLLFVEILELSRTKLGNKFAGFGILEERGVEMWDEDPRFQTL